MSYQALERHGGTLSAYGFDTLFTAHVLQHLSRVVTEIVWFGKPNYLVSDSLEKILLTKIWVLNSIYLGFNYAPSLTRQVIWNKLFYLSILYSSKSGYNNTYFIELLFKINLKNVCKLHIISGQKYYPLIQMYYPSILFFKS